MYCPYERLPDGRWRCPNCDDETSYPREVPPKRPCHREAYGPPRPGLGDMAAYAFSVCGITKEKFSAWIGAECNCPERQDKLNRFGRYLKNRAAKVGVTLPF